MEGLNRGDVLVLLMKFYSNIGLFDATNVPPSSLSGTRICSGHSSTLLLA